MGAPQREGAAPEQFPQSPLRYRWFGGGYRTEDVELVLAECRLAVRQLERRVAPLRERERELQDELDALRQELAGLRARQTELAGQIDAALSHAGKVEQLARDQTAWARQIAEREPSLPEGTPDAAAMSAQPAKQLLRLNEELLASAQTLDAQLKHADETLHGPADRRLEPPPAPEPVGELPPAAPPEPVAAQEAPPPPPVVVPEPRREPEPEPEPLPMRAEVRSYDETPMPERPVVPPRTRIAPEVVALREELTSLELRRRPQAAVRPGYLAPLVIAIVAAGLAAAVGLAVAGYSTAAVILLAAYALAIAVLSVFGIGRPAPAVLMAPEPVAMPVPPELRAEPELELPDAGWPEEALYEEPEPEPEPEPVFDPAEAHRELAQMARERARRLVELGDAVEFGDEDAANRARARLRELDALMAAKEAEIESAGDGRSGDSGMNGERWHGPAVSSNSQYDEL